jgi:NAD+--asparagine ADP-ribosyltransferase
MTAQSLMAEYVAAQEATRAALLPASSAAAVSFSRRSAAPAPLPKVNATAAAFSDADQVLTSFEQRILQHKQAREVSTAKLIER